MNSKSRKKLRIALLAFLLLGLFSSFLIRNSVHFTTMPSNHVELSDTSNFVLDDLTIEQGTNLMENRIYNFGGTLYNSGDLRHVFSGNLYLETQYVDDPTLYYNKSETIVPNEEHFYPNNSRSEFNNSVINMEGNFSSLDDDYYEYRTYTSGDYNGTYSFNQYVDGTTLNDGIDFITSYGSGGGLSKVLIREEIDGHRKVLETSRGYDIYHDFAPSTNFTVEFWFRIEYAAATFYFWFYEVYKGVAYKRVYTGMHHGKFRDGPAETAVYGCSANTWYHLRWDFNGSSSTYDWYINGNLVADDSSYYYSGTNIDRLSLRSTLDDKMWIDAYGSTAEDPNYIIGSNTKALFEKGNYPASYSFTNDVVGSFPSGWTDYSDINCLAKVIDEHSGHKKVLRIRDDNSTGEGGAYFTIDTTPNLIIEFWIGISDTSKVGIVELKENGVLRVEFRISNKFFYRIPSGSYEVTTAGTVLALTLYHIKLVLDDSSSTFDCYVNGVFEGEGFYWNDVSTGINDIRFRTGTSQEDYEIYVDAVGGNWDTNYKMGDNFYYNNYLGTETFESYNKTEEGNYYGSESFDYYTEEGVYYGTYDFRDEADGASGTDIGFVDYTSGSTVDIISEFDGHKKVLRMEDISSAGVTEVIHSITSQNYGTVEFWMGSSDATKRTDFRLRLSDNSHELFRFFIDQDSFWYTDNVGDTDIGVACLDNTLYHIKIEFECTNGGYMGLSQYTWKVYINGEEYGAYNFKTNVASANGIRILTDWTDYSYYAYFDAFGFSWDTTSHSGLGYSEGWNVNPYDIEPLLNSDYFSDLRIGVNSSISVVNSVDGHNNILKLYRESNCDDAVTIADDFNDQVSGIIEFWFRSTDVSVGTYKPLWFGFWYGSEKVRIMFNYPAGNVISYHDGSAYQTIYTGLKANKWYHIRVDFDCSVDAFDMYLNGTSIGSDLGFMVSSNYINGITISQRDNSTYECTHYIDAIGYSWDSDYDVGDNINSHGKDVITDLENNGWVINNLPYISIGINGEYNSHKKILNLSDNNNEDTFDIYNSFGSFKTSGSISFWLKVKDSIKATNIRIMEGDSNKVWFRVYDGKLENAYMPWAYHTILDPFVSNRWYHIKVIFYSNNLLDFYVDGVLRLKGDSFTYSISSGLTRFDILLDDTTVYLDSLTYSWENSNEYGLDINYNERMKEEALIDINLLVDCPSENQSFFINFLAEAYYKSSINTTIYFCVFNYSSNAWLLINNTMNNSTFQKSFFETVLFDSISDNNTYKFKFYGFSSESSFSLLIDKFECIFYRKLNFSISQSFDILGTWKYRFHVPNDNYKSNWVYFDVVEHADNFRAISGSKHLTYWQLVDADVPAGTIRFHDDLTFGYWDLHGVEERELAFGGTVDKDAQVSRSHPNTNYGSFFYMIISQPQGYTAYVSKDISDIPYLTENKTHSNSILLFYPEEWGDPLATIKVYNCSDFDEDSITWNNQPTTHAELITDQVNWGFGKMYLELGNYWSTNYKLVHSSLPDIEIYTKEMPFHSNYPQILHYVSKNYHDLSKGYMYMQTNEQEEISLRSPDYGDINLLKNDYFMIKCQSNAESIELKLINDGNIVKVYSILEHNANFNNQTVQILVDQDITFDQLQFTGMLDDGEYFKCYDIKVEGSPVTQDILDFYLSPYGETSFYIQDLGRYIVKVYDNGILRMNNTVQIDDDLTTEIYHGYEPEEVYLNYFDINNNHLNFYDFITIANYTVNNQTILNHRLSENRLLVDDGSIISLEIYDSYNVLIKKTVLSEQLFLDVTLNIYELKIKNERLNPIMYSLKNDESENSKTGTLFEGEILTMNLAGGNYTFMYLEDGESIWQNFTFTLSNDQYFVVNRSQMCFLSFVNQRGEFLAYNQFKTYIDGSLLYENIFYADIGETIKIEVKDLYDVSIKNQTYTIMKGENYIPVVLNIYSLKIKNMQENFNYINITRDPNYYTSSYSWTEWIAPGEIIEFKLFAGHYKVDITDNENGGNAIYSYTLNGDDFLLISSNNTIAQVIYNIMNVNTSLNNQITDVHIDLTNQNSAINNTIINIDIDLSNVNSSLGNLLTNIDLDITNLDNDIGTLFT
ncbi:MAG: CBM96 family carbohydrate-binding protein, partial [Candidatus Helarchaeota archaeon]